MAPISVAPPLRGSSASKLNPTLSAAVATGQKSKSGTKQSALSRKRNEAEMDSDSHAEQGVVGGSPIKKAKVLFSDNVQIFGASDKVVVTPELAHKEVRHAIESNSHGDDTGIQKLRSLYDPDPKDKQAKTEETSLEALKNYTAALAVCASSLDRSCLFFIKAILSSDWITRDEEYYSLFLRFLCNSVSSQGIWLNDVLQTLTNVLLITPKVKNDGDHDISLRPSQIRQRAHDCLQRVLQIVPSSTITLIRILTRAFPNQEDSRQMQVRFVDGLLKITNYAPELRVAVLNLIADRLVKIDVQIQGDLTELAEDVADGLVNKVLRPDKKPRDDLSEDDSDDSKEDEDDEADEDLDPEAARTKATVSNVRKMDALLDILFSYYDSLFSARDTLEIAIDALISQFTSIILPTYRSRHSQFLLFHFAQSNTELIDIFVGVLIRTAFDTSRPPFLRQSAAAYLSSFVARARHIPHSVVRDVFFFINSHLERLRNEHTPSCRGPDPRRYATYYSLMQALLYIFCFRWRDLAHPPRPPLDNDHDILGEIVSPHNSILPSPSPVSATDEEVDFDVDDPDNWPPKFLSGVKEALNLNIFGPLNPLKVCAAPIVAEFARISHHLNIMYVYHLIDANRRVRLPLPSSGVFAVPAQQDLPVGAADDDWLRLDAYFPFDPYRLPQSKRWVEPDYREWVGVPGLDEKADLDTDEESEIGEDEEDGNGSEDTGTD